MALSDIVIPTRTIEYQGASFTVHGVTANDVMRMLFEAEHDIERILDAYDSMQGGEGSDGREAIGLLLREAPELAARLIASAADEPAQWPTVARLPVSVQAEALAAVWAMTFEGPDSVKKFVASLVEMTNSMKALKPKAA
jgi:hypothetical protein